MVSRAERRPVVEVWPVMLREKLPAIAIPLREGEAEPQVDLQQLLHDVYDTAGLDLVAYEQEPEPPLAPADAIWAGKIIEVSQPG